MHHQFVLPKTITINISYHFQVHPLFWSFSKPSNDDKLSENGIPNYEVAHTKVSKLNAVSFHDFVIQGAFKKKNNLHVCRI